MALWLPFFVLLGITAFYLALALFIWVRILSNGLLKKGD